MNFARLIESLRDLRETSAASALKEQKLCPVPIRGGQVVVAPEFSIGVAGIAADEVWFSNA